jgi:hypothetical protein
MQQVEELTERKSAIALSGTFCKQVFEALRHEAALGIEDAAVGAVLNFKISYCYTGAECGALQRRMGWLTLALWPPPT